MPRLLLFAALALAFAVSPAFAATASPALGAGSESSASLQQGDAEMQAAEEPKPGAEEPEKEEEPGLFRSLEKDVDLVMGDVNAIMDKVLFFDLVFWDDVKADKSRGIKADSKIRVPAIVLWLIVGAIFFTVYMGFISFRGFGHAISVVRGKYDNPNEVGEVTHFQALASALSATVGLGNIAGVALAVTAGGPGATFWMIAAGLLGMSSKFTECTLGQMYRVIQPDGHVSGGPMRYLADGLKERGLPTFGKILAFTFAGLCIMASFGGGNMFQVVQSMGAIKFAVGSYMDVDPASLDKWNWIYGASMALVVGMVIIGGIKRIASTAEKIVPAMCSVYVLASLFILVTNYTEIPHAISLIIGGAFTPSAAYGGFIGVLVIGFQRAAFSNEAGVGSAAIAHSAAKTDEPVREGIVALLEPFIDTVVVCTMTALVIVITGAYDNPDEAYVAARETKNGAGLTSLAFEQVISWFPLLLSAAVLLFAFSTMISWSYYGERCWTYVFGPRSSTAYKVVFCLFVFIGALVSATNILVFSDSMILAMAFPNILGIYFLVPKVKEALGAYMDKLRSNSFKTFK
ncbi:MAG: alanine/glycine:cation symporter family protein [Planctomycetota bacterium]